MAGGTAPQQAVSDGSPLNRARASARTASARSRLPMSVQARAAALLPSGVGSASTQILEHLRGVLLAVERVVQQREAHVGARVEREQPELFFQLRFRVGGLLEVHQRLAEREVEPREVGVGLVVAAGRFEQRGVRFLVVAAVEQFAAAHELPQRARAVEIEPRLRRLFRRRHVAAVDGDPRRGLERGGAIGRRAALGQHHGGVGLLLRLIQLPARASACESASVTRHAVRARCDRPR